MSNNPLTRPTIKRRLISMVYETLLGLAVLFLPLLIVELAVQASLAGWAWHLRQLVAFLVLGFYFIHQWTRDGQTLAMKTWRMRLVSTDGGPVSPRAATVRYLLSWMWIAPAGLICMALGLERWHKLEVIFAGVLLWSLTALLDKDRQFLHDKLAGTRLVQLPPLPKKKKVAAPV
ncbi:RDD family protein [Duganella sp. FT80W]|uniref:RDD family protein n=1 Tax=Duganella guangzhouensis TaxID=2666084 RepID=A0A6I2KTG5_9BURK|nr:RDD family protein [Duganella guangzhouensis]MRW89063.1 RDD family protein [Duganella guangzhouensis]